MQTIRTQTIGKHELRLVLVRGTYVGVVNRHAGGQAARIEGADPDALWDKLLIAAGATKAGFFGFDGAIARFRRFYPDGFEDPRYLTNTAKAGERAYKLAACAALSRDLPLADVLGGGTGLGAAALLDMKAVLGRHDLAKWTCATYLPFLWRPDRHMFLKPEVTKDFAVRVGDRFADDYQPALGIAVYDSLLRLVGRIRDETTRAGLPPRDNIDIQSFVWTVGKYTDEDAPDGQDQA